MPPVGITAANLSRMRTNAQKLMPDTCAVDQSQLVADGSGGKKRSYVQIAASEPCRFDAAGGQEDPSLGLNERAAFFNVHLRYNSVVGLDCQIRHNGHTYEVWSVADDQTPVVTKTALVKRIDPTP